MTLDEAIAHAWEVSDRQGCTECGLDHMQLARWLEELKARREAEEGERWLSIMLGAERLQSMQER